MSILKISEAATIAIHSLLLLAMKKDRMRSSKEISAILGVSEAHLAKVMQTLVRANFINSTRGPKGGFTLKKQANEIYLYDIYELFDGPVETKTCSFDANICNGTCIIDKLTSSLKAQFSDIFENTTVEDVLKKYN